jgi:hypothetical protein
MATASIASCKRLPKGNGTMIHKTPDFGVLPAKNTGSVEDYGAGSRKPAENTHQSEQIQC